MSLSDASLYEEGLTLTPSAVRQIHRLRKEHGKEAELMLRITVDSGGCKGFQYAFALDSLKNKDDQIFTKEGASVVIDDISLSLVKGSEVDFSEALIGSAFVIRNPKASSACGCGNSFSI